MRIRRTSYYSRRLIPIASAIVLAGILAVLFLPKVMDSLYRRQANEIFREAKSVRLAVQVVSLERRAEGRQMFDQSSESGFAEGAEEEVRELSGATRKIRILQCDAAGVMMLQMMCFDDDYVVMFQRDPQKDGMQWTVYQVRRLISLDES